MRCHLLAGSICVLCLFAGQVQAAAIAADEPIYVATPGNAPGEPLAQAVLLGLLNKHFARPAVAFNLIPTDKDWMDSYKSDNPGKTFSDVGYQDLANWAVQSGAVGASIVYSLDEPWSFNTAVTLAGLQNAVPLPVSARGNASLVPSILSTLPVAIYLNSMFQSEQDATAWALVNLYPACTDTSKRVATQHPDLVQKGLLVDLVVQRNIFAFWLPDMCTPGSPQQAQYQQIVAEAHDQGSLLDVLGYFPTQEVVASCSVHHTEITLVSDWNSGLSFWSQMPPSVEQLQQPEAHTQTYDPSKTYVAVIASDGDNMQMDFNADRNLMFVRVGMCQVVPQQCPPLSWTLSNRLADYAPYQLQWYFRQAAATGKDSFLMGPSGYGFLHPSAIAADDPLAQQLVNSTLQAASMMQAQGFVDWDEYDNMAAPRAHRSSSVAAPSGPMDAVYRGPRQPVNEAAMRAYLSRFQGTGMGVFTPTLPALAGFVGDVPVFQEWIRWFGKDDPMDVAEMLGHPDLIGNLGYVYKILDVPTQALGDLVAGLADHVQLVGYRELIDLARQKQALHADPMPSDDLYYQDYQDEAAYHAQQLAHAQAGSPGSVAEAGGPVKPSAQGKQGSDARQQEGAVEHSVIATLAAIELSQTRGASR